MLELEKDIKKMNLDELKKYAIQILKDDDDIFVQCVDELDSWNGYSDGFRAYDMYELDDLHSGMKLHDFLEKLTSDFDINDDYFYYDIYGLKSTDDKAGLYRDNVWESELLDNLIDRYSDLELAWIDKDFDQVVKAIVEYQDNNDDE